MQLRLECRSISYSETVFYWIAEPDARENLSYFGYIVQVSESPIGPWANLYDSPIYAFGYVDRITQRDMIDQRLYYRVMAISHRDGSIFYSDGICLYSLDSNRIADYITNIQQLLLRRAQGHEYLHFSRKKFGARCGACWDDVSRKVIRSKCPQCFGTTYDGGYFSPIKISVNVDPQQKQVAKTPYGEVEANSLSGWTSNVVVIENDELLVSLDRSIKRYLVNNVVPLSLHGAVTKQMLMLGQCKMDDPAQLVPIDVTAYHIDESSIFRRDWKSFR